MDLAEARRLISEADYRPYRRRVKGREYITLKRGSREVGVGPFSQDVWESLESEWAIAVYGPKSPANMVPQPQAQAQKLKLEESDARLVFQYLSKGYDAAQIVEATYLHPDIVEYAAKRYMELKGLRTDWLKTAAEAFKIFPKLKETYTPYIHNVVACSTFKQSMCAHFDKDRELCTLNWEPSIVDTVKTMKLEHAQPFTVMERVEGPYIRIKPTPLWCSLACPYFERKT